MASNDASAAGTFTVGGDLTINRLGFGAMRITGDGIWGAPADPAAARETLRQVPRLGIDFIDTADSYGPYVSEDLICEVLHPYTGLTIATKGGLTRHGPNVWAPLGRPEYLRQCVLMSLRRLGLERIDLWQLHRVDTKVPRDEQFDAIASMQKEGLIRHVGLSEVSVDDIERAGRYFPVATVQSQYNLVNRKNESVLDHCERHGIGFIPWAPLASGRLAGRQSEFGAIGERLQLSPGQLALAWVLRRSKVMLPIPGTGKPPHLADNVEAAAAQLTEADFATLDEQGCRAG